MKFFGWLFLIFTTCLEMSCGSSGTGLSGNYTAYSYSGSGSNTSWRVVLNSSGAFAGIESNSSTSVLGTYVRDLTTGFVKITITSASGSAAPTGLPLNIEGVELLGIALVMQPILSSENSVIVGVLSGNCSPNSYVNNYIYTQFTSSANMTDSTGWLGTASWASSGVAGIPSAFNLASYSGASPVFATTSGACINGVANLSGVGLAYSMANSLFVKLTSGASLLALPVQTVGTMANMNANYNGLVFDGTSNTTSPIQTVLTATGSSAALTLSNVGTDLLTSTGTYASLTLNSVDAPSPGFIEGTITSSGGAQNIVCLANLGLKLHNSLFCVGQNPANAAKPVGVYLISR